jgi:hypothetical protein
LCYSAFYLCDKISEKINFKGGDINFNSRFQGFLELVVRQNIMTKGMMQESCSSHGILENERDREREQGVIPSRPTSLLPPRYQTETILPLSLILLKRECKQ